MDVIWTVRPVSTKAKSVTVPGIFLWEGPTMPTIHMDCPWIARLYMSIGFQIPKKKKTNCVQWVFNVWNFWGKCHLDPYIVCRMCPSSLLMPWCILVLIPVLIPMAFRPIDAQTMRPMKIPASITASQCVPAPENWKKSAAKITGKKMEKGWKGTFR